MSDFEKFVAIVGTFVLGFIVGLGLGDYWARARNCDSIPDRATHAKCMNGVEK